MHDYLYIWHNPQDQFILTSGVELKDVAAVMGSQGGLILLAHQYPDALTDTLSRFDFVPSTEILGLESDDVYSWGDACWVDYTTLSFPSITKSDIASLLYFRHITEPYQGISISSIKNRFLAYGHDDGWYLKIYYNTKLDLEYLISKLPLLKCGDRFRQVLSESNIAFWIDEDGIFPEIPTFDVDSILNRRLLPGSINFE